jgi:hypothetical protein
MTELEKRFEQLKALLRPIAHDHRETYRARAGAALHELATHFAGMSESERRRLAPEILRLHKAAMKLHVGDDEPADGPLDSGHTSIALVATASLTELQRTGWWGQSALAYETLAERRPDWLVEAIELGLDQATSWFIIGKVARGINRLVADGIVRAPEHPHYAIGIAYGYIFGGKPLVDCVRNDLPLIEAAIWRQFEVEGGGEISLAHFDKYIWRKSGGRWADALVVLVDEGRLDRQRLLDASLDALNRGFAQFRAGWFSRFHESLAPTPDERATRTERYLVLLASPLSPTVSFALAALKMLQKAGKLDVNAVLARMEPALYATSAATAKGALALLAQAARTVPDRRGETARLAAIGLEHPNSEVQAAALSLVEHCAPAMTREVRDAVEQRLGLVSPTLRGRAAALLGPVAVERSTDFADVHELKAAAKRLPRDLRHLAGIDAALDALGRGSGDVPRAVFTGMDVPRLDPDKAVTAISTFEELIDEALVAIEHPHDLDRVERVLASALSFAAARPSNAAETLAPLAKSLKRGAKVEDWETPRGALQLVMSALVSGTPAVVQVAEADPRAVMVLRASAMAQAIHARTARIQLSTPTHKGCWIDPLVLVDRSKKAGKELLGVADQILALLRLPPDNRSQALKAASDVAGEWGAALRYALSGDERPGKTRSLWVAAARGRAPFDEDARVAGLVGSGTRGADLPLRLTPRISYRSYTNVTVAEVAVVTDDTAAEGCVSGEEVFDRRRDTQDARDVDPDHCLTTVDLANPSRLRMVNTYYHGSRHGSGNWATALWPQHPEPVFALAALAPCMIDGNSGIRSGNEPLANGLKLILDPDVPIGPMALFMLCRGLNAIDPAAAQATVDALIAAIEDGRLDGESLGQAMHAFLMTGLVFGKRWPTHLKEVAHASILAHQVVRRALERALHPGEPQRKLRDIHAWIETLHELSIEADEAIGDPLARDGLNRFPKGGKAAKSAQALLDLAPGNGMTRSAAAAHAIQARLARAGRWAARAK